MEYKENCPKYSKWKLEQMKKETQEIIDRNKSTVEPKSLDEIFADIGKELAKKKKKNKKK